VTVVSAASRLVFVLLCTLALAACRIDTEVAIDVREDGSGTVTMTVRFDGDAVARVPDLATDTLRTDDLVEAGWVVSRSDAGDAGVTYRATKAFAGPDQLPVVLAELTGPDGVLRDVELVRERSFAETTWRFTATADLSRGIEAFSDPELAALLAGAPFGRDPAALARELGGPPESFVDVRLLLALPHDLRAGAGDTERQDTALWELPLGGASRSLQAESHDVTWTARLWAIGAGASGFAFVVLMGVRGLRRRRAILRAVEAT
jgi:hypothetical protein